MTVATVSAPSLSQTSQEDSLVADIPPAVRGYLREIAKAEFQSRFLRTVLVTAILLPLGINVLDFDLKVVILGIVAAAAVATFAFGHVLRWQDRREQQLLRIELDYRREHGKWRWER
jgi:hypothetical protein